MSNDRTRTEFRWIDASSEAELAALGDRGWEIAAVVPGAEGPRVCLKRPHPAFRERVTLDQKRHVYASLGLPRPEDDR